MFPLEHNGRGREANNREGDSWWIGAGWPNGVCSKQPLQPSTPWGGITTGYNDRFNLRSHSNEWCLQHYREETPVKKRYRISDDKIIQLMKKGFFTRVAGIRKTLVSIRIWEILKYTVGEKTLLVKVDRKTNRKIIYPSHSGLVDMAFG